VWQLSQADDLHKSLAFRTISGIEQIEIDENNRGGSPTGRESAATEKEIFSEL
jgi:hypothetical protein